jgi:hypothetical protein
MATIEHSTEAAGTGQDDERSTGAGELLDDAGISFEFLIESMEGVAVPYDRDRLAAEVDDARKQLIASGELRKLKRQR